MEKTNYFQPEDDGSLLIPELERTCVKKFIVVCIQRNKNFPLVYLQANATSESEAIKIIQKENPFVKVLRAYLSK